MNDFKHSVGQENSAFSSFKNIKNSSVSSGKINGNNDCNLKFGESNILEKNYEKKSEDVKKEESPVWSFRTTNYNYQKIKNSGNLANGKLNSPNVDNNQSSSFGCGLLNKFFLNETEKNNKVYSTAECNSGLTTTNALNNYLYKEEDENYEENRSPSLSIESDLATIQQTFTYLNLDLDEIPTEKRAEQISSKNVSIINNKNSPKILSLIEDYLNKEKSNQKETELPVYEKYFLKKLNCLANEKSSSLPLRNTKNTKKISSYYNDYYKDIKMSNGK
jgi:hypothetical protein